MKNITLHIILSSAIACAILFSCRKEHSYEGGTGNNEAPIALAGVDTIIILPADSIILNGNNSYDPDGNIAQFIWSKISGPSSFFVNPQSSSCKVKMLVKGIYRFALTVTDNKGLSSKDTVMITVDSTLVTNHPPVADAGADQTIVSPANSVAVNGNRSADPDNNITSYQWSKVAGPSSFNLSNPTMIATTIDLLVEGHYQFELKVTDAGGLFSSDTVSVTVNANLICGMNRPQVNIFHTLVGSLSKPRALMAVASAGNKTLFAGGVSHAGGPEMWGSSRVDIYDISTNTWTIAELSVPRYGIAAIAAGNKIFFAGGTSGETGDILETYHSTVDIYDVTTDTWSIASLSERMTDIAVATVGNKVFFAGGYGTKTIGNTTYYGQFSNTVDIYDLSTNTWTATTLSQARTAISAVTLNNKVYFAGGQTAFIAPNHLSAKIDIYDNISNSWTISTLSEPKATWKGGMAVVDKIHWAGGAASQGEICKVEIREPAAQTTSFDYLSLPATVNAILNHNRIFYTRFFHPEVDIYNINTSSWSISTLPILRPFASFISVNNILYMAGGFTDGTDTVCSSEVWKLEF